jgi:5'-nucleotidase
MRLGILVLVASLAQGAPAPAAEAKAITLTIVGTADLHGHVTAVDGRGGLALLGGYLANLRRARAADGGAVLLVDAGDAFQGTLESNPNEGAAVVLAMNRLGYAAMAVGNHEFDFGPVGPATTPQTAADDPRGALKARAAEARFPFLAANILDGASGQVVAWPNVRPSTTIDVLGLKVGIVGLTTAETLRTTMGENVRDLRLAPLAATLEHEAAALRAQGCSVVIAAAHAGARCTVFDNPDDLSSCEDGEILQVARALPPGAVDVIVAGHTHAGVAHRVNGVAVIEAYSYGRAFGRVDLTVDAATHRVAGVRISRPQDVDGGGTYEGAPVAPDAEVAADLAPAVAAAKARSEERLGVHLPEPLKHAYGEESALGNLFADLMRASRPGADVAVTNGGGLRADLAAGELTYGALFEAYPFDNRFALLRITGAGLSRMLAANLASDRGILSVSGVRAGLRCEAGRAVLTLTREDGRRVGDDELLTLATSDFLAGGGDAPALEAASPVTLSADLIREAIAQQLRDRGGVIRAEALLEPRRLAYPGKRPVRCGS